MRIAFIGDLQYWMPWEEKLDLKMEQVKKFSPDLSIVMGDFGGSKMRSTEGLLETKEYVSMVGCPFHAIFGNHDVEYWPDNINEYDPYTTYKKVFGEEPYKSYIINGVLVVCVSIERQPFEKYVTPYTVYISDEQFEWAKNEIESHKDMPCIFVSHPPIAGSGLRCERPMHNAALDTYLDHTFKAERWVKLLSDNPQIKACFSAHYHMGHDYDTSITERNGVVHISCGVMTCCTRDERAHTRIADITEDKRLLVYTLDHNNDSALILDAEIDLTGKEKSKGKIARPERHEILIGEEKPCKVWYDDWHKSYYISTERGMLWEFSEELCDFCGALSYKNAVSDVYVLGNELVMEYPSGDFAALPLDSRSRWQYKGNLKQAIRACQNPEYPPLPTLEFSVYDSKEGWYIKF